MRFFKFLHPTGLIGFVGSLVSPVLLVQLNRPVNAALHSIGGRHAC